MREKLFLIVTTVVFVVGIATGGAAVGGSGTDAPSGRPDATGSDIAHCC
ncbi:hypothetical protein [Streptomyces eurythermus]